MANWISSIILAPGSNGISGGAWKLVITRISPYEDQHWWGLVLDPQRSRGNLKVYSAHESDTDCSLVTLKSQLPFEDAIEEFDLVEDVFGSRTLWSMTHVRTFEDSGLPKKQEGGWTWTHEDTPIGFPFRSKYFHGTDLLVD